VSTSPAVDRARYPTASSRIGLGIVVGFLLAVAFVALPYVVLSGLGRFGLQPALDSRTVLWAGAILAGLGAARYVLKPSRAYGPSSIAYALGWIAYLAWLIAQSPIAFTFRGATISLGYGTFLLAAMVVPVLGLVAGFVTTIEDAAYPGDRLPFDFPGAAGRL
jgi:hypothetical protein